MCRSSGRKLTLGGSRFAASLSHTLTRSILPLDLFRWCRFCAPSNGGSNRVFVQIAFERCNFCLCVLQLLTQDFHRSSGEYQVHIVQWYSALTRFQRNLSIVDHTSKFRERLEASTDGFLQVGLCPVAFAFADKFLQSYMVLTDRRWQAFEVVLRNLTASISGCIGILGRLHGCCPFWTARILRSLESLNLCLSLRKFICSEFISGSQLIDSGLSISSFWLIVRLRRCNLLGCCHRCRCLGRNFCCCCDWGFDYLTHWLLLVDFFHVNLLSVSGTAPKPILRHRCHGQYY